MRLVALLLVAVGCGDNLPDPALPRSGTRLKLGWYEYDGNARELEPSWYFDSELRERCSGELWSDGKRYCTPATDEAVYISETCTRSVGRTLIGLSPAPYFASTFAIAGESLPRRSRLFRRGAPTLPPVSAWQKGTEGCFQIALDEDFDYFELAAEIVTSDLAQLHRSGPHGLGTLAMITETSDDGMNVPIALFDRATDSECIAVERANSDRVECVPTAAGIVSYFHDAGCREPELAVPLGAPTTLAVSFDVATSCWTSYAVGEEVSAPPLYEHSGPLCLEVAPPAGRRFFTMGAMQPLPALSREREPSASRIHSISRTTNGLRVTDPLLYDEDLDTDCRHDDSLACVPRTTATLTRKTALTYFADPQCQTAIDLAQVPMGSCDAPVRFATDGDLYYPLGEPYPGPIYVPSTGDTCSGYAPPVPFVGYTVGPPLDPAVFARAQLTIDP
jgi:hypothetical protein